jgi:ribosomal protein S18 acetylase RimI-like enzyme
MEHIRVQPNITQVDRAYLHEAIDVLSKAFTNDPMMQYLFESSTATYSRSLYEMFRFSCEVRLLLNWPLLGCWDTQHRLVGVAGLSLPGKAVWPPTLQKVYEGLKACIGINASTLMEKYGSQADTNRPNEPHYQLGMIGIDPHQQGHGYGGMLLQVLHKMSEAHPTSTGIWLDTENPRNLPWYQRFGYQIRALTQLGDVQIWGMFRPNQNTQAPIGKDNEA